MNTVDTRRVAHPIERVPSRADSESFPGPQSDEPLLLARTPIADSNRAIRAYELSADPQSVTRGSTHRTSDLSSRLIHSLAHVVGITSITESDQLVFVPTSAEVLSQHHYLALPPSQTVLVIAGMQGDTKSLAEECTLARSRGFAIAINHADSSIPREVAQHAAYARASITDRTKAQIDALVAAAHSAGRWFIALDVDSNESADRAISAKCDLLQGRFIFAPRIETPREIQGAVATHVRLLSLLSTEPLDRQAITETIASDLALSHALLRRTNSSAVGVRQRVSSIAQALSLLGDEHIRTWGTLTALAGLKGTAPDELIVTSLVRARFCSELATQSGFASHAVRAHLAGLFSTIDVILSMSMERALAFLGLADDVAAVLNGDRSTFLGKTLALVESCEQGAWATANGLRAQLGLAHSTVTITYYDALGWARNLWHAAT